MSFCGLAVMCVVAVRDEPACDLFISTSLKANPVKLPILHPHVKKDHNLCLPVRKFSLCE